MVRLEVINNDVKGLSFENFNSKMVRLEESRYDGVVERIITFQFQNGTIRSKICKNT